jgi:hypothetical protein
MSEEIKDAEIVEEQPKDLSHEEYDKEHPILAWLGYHGWKVLAVITFVYAIWYFKVIF